MKKVRTACKWKVKKGLKATQEKKREVGLDLQSGKILELIHKSLKHH